MSIKLPERDRSRSLSEQPQTIPYYSKALKRYRVKWSLKLVIQVRSQIVIVLVTQVSRLNIDLSRDYQF